MTRISTLALLATLALGAPLTGCAGSQDTQAHELVAAGALLVDVRTPEEFAAGHVDGAVNIPLDELDARMAEIGAKDKQVVVYCQSGRRSASAKRTLDGAGYANVHDMGGMSNW